MTSFTNRIKPDSTELERYFLSVYTGNLWDALEKIKDWHSPEHIEKEIQMKLLKLQQQALPVVPECVGEFLSGKSIFKIANCNVPDDVISWVQEQTYYVYLEKIISHLISLKITGYQVEKPQIEKPQLFYLKNKLTTSYLALDINTGYYEHWGEEIIPKLLNKQGYKTSFTQQEIDSMETGSYELVPVEDGE